ncbi:hypothetical protein MsAg5_15360 [Methanosarcinaceae archaeon Ag5]|uniref:YdhG-like domain-containing protein n=1 Tax=Methanolapillus africanus TaxID=3028297 RepID=A0AAE4MJG7_9EURY|nr:hypothetical protein [Methanosarcinaceae archaeon Ag5]
MSEQTGPATIDEYISAQPPEIQSILNEFRRTVLHTVPDASEKIAWGMPSFSAFGSYVAQFAAHKNHIGFYPGPEAIVVFEKELSSFKTSKGGIQFPYGKPVPYDLIEKIVQYNVDENKKKMAEKENLKKQNKKTK